MMGVPAHGAWPGGHAAEGFLAATLLHQIITTAQGSMASASKNLLQLQLDRLAARIAQNRVVAGVHFPADTLAGWVMGRVFANYLVQRCEKKVNFKAGVVAGELMGGRDFSLVDLEKFDLPNDMNSLGGSLTSITPLVNEADLREAPTMAYLFKKAKEEWQ